MGWVLSGREHASEAFEGIQYTGETALLIISRTIPTVWVHFGAMVPRPTLIKIKSEKDPIEGIAFVSQVASLVTLCRWVSASLEVWGMWHRPQCGHLVQLQDVQGQFYDQEQLWLCKDGCHWWDGDCGHIWFVIIRAQGCERAMICMGICVWLGRYSYNWRKVNMRHGCSGRERQIPLDDFEGGVGSSWK